MCGNGVSPTLVAVRVRTRNHMGISSRTLLCCNYGMDYDFGEQQQTDEEFEAAKRFKGRLDQLFQNQREGAKKEDDKRPDEAEPTKEPGSEPGPSPRQGLAMISLTSLDTCEFGILKGENGVKLVLKALEDVKTNKKVTPNTVLLFVGNGKIKKPEDGESGQMQYMFPKTDKCMVHFATKVTAKKDKPGEFQADLEKAETLSGLIARKKIKEVMNLASFPPGASPTSLCKKDTVFDPVDENARLVVTLD